MAKCDICGKGVHFGNNVSHSHRRSNAIWNSNVKSVKCKVNGGARRMHVCTSCLKSGKLTDTLRPRVAALCILLLSGRPDNARNARLCANLMSR